ncbi:hypothetical protein [Devosia sp.]|uniref:hypothetical protein n=1 Tax=Devosia sp. TaxID=1871048 RepID=UPI0032662A49
MNPSVSANWIEIAFPALMTVALCVFFWRDRPPRSDLFGRIGLVMICLTMIGATAANLFYQRAINVRAWPTTGIFDQVVVTPAGDVFVKLTDPIMGRAVRVQRYNCQGEFIAAFDPDSKGGIFKIAVNPDDTLSIHSVRSNSVDLFRLDGTFLSRQESNAQEERFEFLRLGPSMTSAGGCEFITDPQYGHPSMRKGNEISPLEPGDWILERVLNRQYIYGGGILGGILLLISAARIWREGLERA